MKTKLIILLICLIALSAFRIQTFAIDDFSKEYYAKYRIVEFAGKRISGWLTIYSQKTDKSILKVRTEYYPDQLNGNIKCEDYNFDGRIDFAVNRVSDGWSREFDIYLQTATGEWVLNKELTEIGNEGGTCGSGSFDFITLDPKSKTLRVDFTSGAGDFSSTYEFFNNQPRLVEQYDKDETLNKTKCIYSGKNLTKKMETITKPCYYEDSLPEEPIGFVYRTVVETTYVNGKPTSARERITGYDPRLITFSFVIDKSGSKVLFHWFSSGGTGSHLMYRCLSTDGVSEYEYYKFNNAQAEESIDFNSPDLYKHTMVYSKVDSRSEMQLGNDSVCYTIYQNSKNGDAGILVKTNGKTEDLKARKGTITGSLDSCTTEYIETVYNKK